MVNLWPAIGQTVLDESGNVIPVNGITVASLDAYYSELVLVGRLLTYDPLAGPTPPTVIGQDQPVLAVDTDTTLAALRGYRNGAQAITTGATAQGAGDGGAWTWLDAFAGPYDADHIGPGLPGGWQRNDGIGGGLPPAGTPGDILWTDLGGSVAWRPFPLGSVFVFNVQDYGATGNGVTDDINAIEACIAAAINNVGVFGDPLYRVGRAAIYFPYTTNFYRISRTILVQNCKNLRFITDSNGNCLIRWYGNATDPMVRMDGADNCWIDGFSLWRGGANRASAAVQWVSATQGEYETRDCRVVNCNLQSGTLDWKYAFEVLSGGGCHLVEGCTITGYNEHGVHVEAGGRVDVVRCSLLGTYKPDSGGFFCDGGSYSWLGGGGGGGGHNSGSHAIDHYIKSNDGIVYIEVWNSEESERCLVSGDDGVPSDDVFKPIVLTRSRITHNTHLSADGRSISLYNNTTVTIDDNCFLVNGSGVLPARVYVATTHPEPAVQLMRNQWDGIGGALPYSYGRTTGNPGTYFHGVIEYPDTYVALPLLPPNGQQVWVQSGSNYFEFRLPTRMSVVSLGDGDSGSVGYNYIVRSGTIASGASQVQAISLQSAEPNANYEVVSCAVEVTGGVQPAGGVSAHVIGSTKATNGFSVYLSTTTGFSCVVVCELAR